MLSLWYADSPFRMHHTAKYSMELEWDRESKGSNVDPLKIVVTYQDGSYFVEVIEKKKWNAIYNSTFLPFFNCNVKIKIKIYIYLTAINPKIDFFVMDWRMVFEIKWLGQFVSSKYQFHSFYTL